MPAALSAVTAVDDGSPRNHDTETPPNTNSNKGAGVPVELAQQTTSATTTATAVTGGKVVIKTQLSAHSLPFMSSSAASNGNGGKVASPPGSPVAHGGPSHTYDSTTDDVNAVGSGIAARSGSLASIKKSVGRNGVMDGTEGTTSLRFRSRSGAVSFSATGVIQTGTGIPSYSYQSATELGNVGGGGHHHQQLSSVVSNSNNSSSVILYGNSLNNNNSSSLQGQGAMASAATSSAATTTFHNTIISPSGERCIWVLDPMTRKLLVPTRFLVPTQATQTPGTVPSLCIAYLENRCRHPWCRQAHVIPSSIHKLRRDALHAPTCCSQHGDGHDISCLTSRFATISISDCTNKELIASSRVALTVGLQRHLAQSVVSSSSIVGGATSTTLNAAAFIGIDGLGSIGAIGLASQRSVAGSSMPANSPCLSHSASPAISYAGQPSNNNHNYQGDGVSPLLTSSSPAGPAPNVPTTGGGSSTTRTVSFPHNGGVAAGAGASSSVPATHHHHRESPLLLGLGSPTMVVRHGADGDEQRQGGGSLMGTIEANVTTTSASSHLHHAAMGGHGGGGGGPPLLTATGTNLEIPSKLICRLHLSHRCRYLEDCNNIHLCRELDLHLVPPAHLITPLCNITSKMEYIAIGGGDQIYKISVLHEGPLADDDAFAELCKKYQTDLAERHRQLVALFEYEEEQRLAAAMMMRKSLQHTTIASSLDASFSSSRRCVGSLLGNGTAGHIGLVSAEGMNRQYLQHDDDDDPNNNNCDGEDADADVNRLLRSALEKVREELTDKEKGNVTTDKSSTREGVQKELLLTAEGEKEMEKGNEKKGKRSLGSFIVTSTPKHSPSSSSVPAGQRREVGSVRTGAAPPSTPPPIAVEAHATDDDDEGFSRLIINAANLSLVSQRVTGGRGAGRMCGEGLLGEGRAADRHFDCAVATTTVGGGEAEHEMMPTGAGAPAALSIMSAPQSHRTSPVLNSAGIPSFVATAGAAAVATVGGKTAPATTTTASPLPFSGSSFNHQTDAHHANNEAACGANTSATNININTSNKVPRWGAAAPDTSSITAGDASSFAHLMSMPTSTIEECLVAAAGGRGGNEKTGGGEGTSGTSPFSLSGAAIPYQARASAYNNRANQSKASSSVPSPTPAFVFPSEPPPPQYTAGEGLSPSPVLAPYTSLSGGVAAVGTSSPFPPPPPPPPPTVHNTVPQPQPHPPYTKVFDVLKIAVDRKEREKERGGGGGEKERERGISAVNQQHQQQQQNSQLIASASSLGASQNQSLLQRSSGGVQGNSVVAEEIVSTLGASLTARLGETILKTNRSLTTKEEEQKKESQGEGRAANTNTNAVFTSTEASTAFARRLMGEKSPVLGGLGLGLGVVRVEGVRGGTSPTTRSLIDVPSRTRLVSGVTREATTTTPTATATMGDIKKSENPRGVSINNGMGKEQIRANDDDGGERRGCGAGGLASSMSSSSSAAPVLSGKEDHEKNAKQTAVPSSSFTSSSSPLQSSSPTYSQVLLQHKVSTSTAFATTNGATTTSSAAGATTKAPQKQNNATAAAAVASAPPTKTSSSQPPNMPRLSTSTFTATATCSTGSNSNTVVCGSATSIAKSTGIGVGGGPLFDVSNLPTLHSMVAQQPSTATTSLSNSTSTSTRASTTAPKGGQTKKSNNKATDVTLKSSSSTLSSSSPRDAEYHTKYANSQQQHLFLPSVAPLSDEEEEAHVVVVPRCMTEEALFGTSDSALPLGVPGFFFPQH